MKKFLNLALALLIAFSMTACSTNEGTKTPTDASEGESQEAITFSISSGVVNQDSYQQLCCVEFAKKVEELSNGLLQCEVLAGNSVGGERELCESLQLGTLEMCYTSDIGLNSCIGTIGWAFCPMMITSWEDGDNYYRNGWISERISKYMEDVGLVRLGEGTNSIRSFCTTGKEVSNPDDLKGLKIRVPTLDMLVSFYEKMGAMSVSVATSEQVAALEQGVCEAVDNNVYGHVTNGIWEYMSVYCPIDYMYNGGAIIASADWYNALPAEYQAWIKEAAEYAGQYEKDSIYEDEQTLIEGIKEGTSKMKMVEPSDQLLQKCYDAALEVLEEYADTFNPEDLELVREQYAKSGWARS